MQTHPHTHRYICVFFPLFLHVHTTCMDTPRREIWDLEAPRLLLSIVGGAGEMNLDPAVARRSDNGPWADYRGMSRLC